MRVNFVTTATTAATSTRRKSPGLAATTATEAVTFFARLASYRVDLSCQKLIANVGVRSVLTGINGRFALHLLLK